MQLRSSIAFADIAAGRLDEAARVIAEIAADERRSSSVGWSFSGLTGRGGARPGPRRRRPWSAAPARTASTRSPGVGSRVSRARTLLMPWVLVAESNAVFAHVLHERRH